MSRRRILIALSFAALSLPSSANAGWEHWRSPGPGPAEVIGGYAAGCLDGALALPADTPGLRIARPERERHYGHPLLVDYLRWLATEARSAGLGTLQIGDLAQARGGPMPNGHRSHQTGLDADVWLALRDVEAPVSVVDRAAGRLSTSLWDARYAALLRLAAAPPEVSRIFVNPVIKRALCASEPDRSWLQKLRPWWGHDAHFHVRLHCPPGSTACEAQAAIEPGDGCGDDLDAWVRDQQAAARRPAPPPPPPPDPVLPAACDRLR